jgi:hypothetical protein
MFKMFYEIKRLKCTGPFKHEYSSIVVEAKNEKELIEKLMEKEEIFFRFVDLKCYTYTIRRFADRRFTGTIFGIYIHFHDINDKEANKNFILTHEIEIMKFLNNSGLNQNKDPFLLSLRGKPDFILKSFEYLLKSIFHYKENVIERFIKHKLFDKNTIGIMNSFQI